MLSLEQNPMSANNTYSLSHDGSDYTFTIGWSYADFLKKNSVSPSEKTEKHFLAVRQEAWKLHREWSVANQKTTSIRSGVAFNRKAKCFTLKTIETREGGTPDKASVKAFIEKREAASDKYLAQLHAAEAEL